MDLERSKDNLTNGNSLRKIKENEEIKPLVDGLRQELISSFVSILNEHKISQGDFEGFAVIDAEYSDQKHLLLSYLANQDYEIDEKIKRSSLAVSMLKKYFDGFLMSRIEKSGLILRANDLIKKNVESKEIIYILNNEFSEKLLEEFGYANNEFKAVQAEIIDLTKNRSMPPDQIAGFTFRALTRYNKNNKKNIDVSKNEEENSVTDEKSILVKELSVADEFKNKSILWVKSFTAKDNNIKSDDWLKMSHLLYMSRLKSMAVRGYQNIDRILEDGYFSVLVEILVSAYQDYLKKNYSAERKYNSLKSSIYEANQIFEKVFEKNDKMLFQCERNDFLRYTDKYFDFGNEYKIFEGNVGQLKQSLFSFVREKITNIPGNDNQEITELVNILDVGVKRSDFSFFTDETNSRYIAKGKFLQENIKEIDFILKKMQYINHLIDKKVNFFNLNTSSSEYKTDYLSFAREFAFSQSLANGLKATDLIHGLFFNFQYVFVCKMCDNLKILSEIDLNVTNSKLSKSYFNDALVIQKKIMTNVKFERNDLDSFINCINIICRDAIAVNKAIREDKIIYIDTEANNRANNIRIHKQSILDTLCHFKHDLGLLKNIFK